MGSKGGGHVDYGPMRASIDRQTAVMTELGRESIFEARREYDRMEPYYTALAEQQRESAAAQTKQAQELYQHWQDTTKPIEERLAREAQAFDTEDTRRQLAAQASAEVARSSASQRAQNERMMASMGVNPNSGRFQGLGRASALQEAAMRAGSMTKARQQARAEAQQRLYNAAALGRGLPGQSVAAYGGSSSSAATGGALYRQPGQDYFAGRSSGVAAIGQAGQTEIAGLQGIMDTQQRESASRRQATGQGIGAGLGVAAGVASIFSDIRMKTDIVHVGEEKGFNLYTFKYKSGGEKRYIGVIADEVERKRPDAVYKVKGFKCVDYDKIGIKFKRVK